MKDWLVGEILYPFICSIGNIIWAGVQNYVLAERRVTPACTYVQKTEQAVDVQADRVFARHTYIL